MIRIGPAGSGGLGNLDGVHEVARLELDCMEVEFTYGVRLSLADARRIGELAREKKIVLSVHAPYYINLASNEAQKIAASKKRIVDSCERAAALGAKKVVFHAGFYQGKPAEQTYEMIKQTMVELQRVIRRCRWPVQLCPEITGKPSQFGTLDEILRLKRDTGCGITVDFAHLYARQQGVIDYARLLDRLPRSFHAHFSGIEYGPKGETRHVITSATCFEPLAAELVKRRINITIINESPQPYEDAVMMKDVLRRMKPASCKGGPSHLVHGIGLLMPIHNADIADIFDEIADYLEIDGENPFRIRAYRNAARTVRGLGTELKDMVERQEELTLLPGIGKDLAAKIHEILETGTAQALQSSGPHSPGCHRIAENTESRSQTRGLIP